MGRDEGEGHTDHITLRSGPFLASPNPDYPYSSDREDTMVKKDKVIGKIECITLEGLDPGFPSFFLINQRAAVHTKGMQFYTRSCVDRRHMRSRYSSVVGGTLNRIIGQ